MDEFSLYIIIAHDPDGTTSEYEHGNIVHAREHFNLETHAELIGYKGGRKTLLESK